MSTQNKQLVIAEPQLNSDSEDLMRNALGLSINGTADNTYLNAISYTSSLDSIEADGFVNKYTYYYRIFGNSSNIINDKHWKNYVVGGDFNDQPFTGIYVGDQFTDHYHTEQNPYSLQEVKINGLIEASSPNYISIQPVFNDYIQNYSDYTNNVSSITEIPNVYTFVQENVVPVPLGFLRLDKMKKDLRTIFKFDIPNLDFSYDQTGSLQQNIMFVTKDSYDSVETLNDACNYVPFYTNMNFNFDQTGQFIKECYANKFEHMFIRTLKETFLEQDDAPSLQNKSFNLGLSQVNSDGEAEETSSESEIKIADVYEMLDYALKNYDPETIDFEYLLDESEEAYAQYDTNSIRRLEKTIPTLRQFTSLGNLLGSYDYTNTFEAQPLSIQNKYNEVVAYRVEKVYNSQTVQNYWFLNQEEVEAFQFNDNQVSYGKDYVYNVYKYVLIMGFEYSYSGIRVSRTLGYDTGIQRWGLEIYDPATDEAIEPLFESKQISNTLRSGEQIQSRNKYVADFQIDVKPSVKIAEVQLFSKQVSLLDAPTNFVTAIPNYTLDNSRRLQFDILYGLTDLSVFPSVLNSTEEDYKTKFMNSYDLLDGEEFMIESRSMARKLQIFKIDFKPTSRTDFDGKMIIEKDLKMRNHDHTHTNITIYDRVVPNQKYYYFFRVTNQVDSPAIGSNIIEAELVDDGGYKFGIFNAYYEQDLEVKPFNRPIQSFRKLINIVPNMENMILNDEEVDYSDTSENQIQNVKFGQSDDPVWDKTFKIRLTSKKTGKKIDINLTHKLV